MTRTNSTDEVGRRSGRRPVRITFFTVLTLCSLRLAQASSGEPALPHESDLSALKREVVSNYAAIMAAASRDSLGAVRQLRAAVNDFLQQPSEAGLTAARQAWLDARVPYSQSEVSRFYDGPIDQLEAKINSWPIDEHYIDYVKGAPDAGIINDPTNFPALTRELILSLNEKEGKKNISTGFHAIEFLLWGQDLSTNGPGNRSWRDYTDSASNGERRRAYLRIVTTMLVEHLETVAGEWESGKPDNYRASFVAMEPDAALACILKGIGALSGPEIAGERLTAPYETKEQEEEQDCFSDNTCNDLVNDALGIQNVYLGRYQSACGQCVNGPGVRELLLRADAGVEARLSAKVREAVACARAIPAPFDQAILGINTSPGRVAIKRAVAAFQAESDLTAEAAKALGIKLTL
jgi:putative iron-regulated protein